MNRIALVFACLLLFSGCMPKEAVRMPTALENYSGDKAGQVFGTLGSFRKTPFSSVSIFFRQLGSKESGRFYFAYDGILGGPPVDVEESNVRGTVFVGRLPAGDYELFQINFFINRGQFGTTTFSSREEFSIPFKVEEGKSTYLGEFIAYHTTGKNFFGMTVPGGGYYVVADKSERDITILSKKPEVYPAWPVLKSVANPEALKLPYFQVSAE